MKTAQQTAASASEAISLDDLFDHIRYSDPFAQDRVSEPDGMAVDVQTIHGSKFQQLVGYAEGALRDRRGTGVVLWGDPGIGKSHLLARFANWAKARQACFVFLHNIQVSPERLPRYILKCVISRFTLGRVNRFYNTPLYNMVKEAVKQAIQQYGQGHQGELTKEFLAACYGRFVDAYIERNPVVAGADDRLVFRVLFRFFLSAMAAHRQMASETIAADAIRWLSGDMLDKEELVELGLVGGKGYDAPPELPDNQTVERVLIALMELAHMLDRPFVLCFDQVENLGDDQIKALTQFSHALIDAAKNLLSVTSGVQADLLDYKAQGIIRQASWDRIAQDEVRLDPISPVEARQLLEMRLERFFENYLTLPQVKEKVGLDTLFPLGRPWLEKKLINLIECRPREVIAWARARWRHERSVLTDQGGEAWLAAWPKEESPRIEDQEDVPIEELIDRKVAGKIKEQIKRRELDPSALPPDESNLCGLIESLLAQCLEEGGDYTISGIEHPPGHKTALPTFQLLVREQAPGNREATTGVTLVVTGSKTSAAASLRRIVNEAQPPTHVLLVTDERQPLSLGKKGVEHFEKLKTAGKNRFQQIELSFEQYAQLDALQAVIGEAKSGDLEVHLPNGNGFRLSADDVIASHHRQDRYRKHPLLRELLTEEALPEEGPPSEVLLPREDLKQYIVAQLALTMGCNTVEITMKYKEHKQLEYPLEEIQEQIEDVATELSAEEVVNATPLEEGMFLLLRP